MKELVLTPLNLEAKPAFSTLLASITQRVDELDNLRKARALHSSGEAFRQVFTLLPTLIHFNLPELPGYVPKAPSGIARFELSEEQAVLFQQLFDILPEEWTLSPPSFDGLYAMGSVGSITQSTSSDLDLWLCHSETFSAKLLSLVEQKLAAVRAWAMTLGVEVNFYLMNPSAFKQRIYKNGVNEDHNGSAQHFFLLDEFYRSAVRLAGKRILWLHIENGKQGYESFVNRLVQNGDLNLSDWVDFGDFASLPIEEYFGASLWQLYKGTRKPYKSAIKILLLESYAETYPITPWISKKFKQQLFSRLSVRGHFDPYLAMLEQVTDYLSHRKEFARLDRLRRCFYIKAVEQQHDKQRLALLQSLVNVWGWSEEERESLDNRPHWKIKQAMQQQQMIVDLLLQSYRNLIRFARRFHIDPNIMPQDTDVLMRKLYSVFEVVPGKVALLNEHLASKVSEEHVTFIEVGEGQAVKAGWYLFNHAPSQVYDSHTRYVQYQKSLTKLVAWAYFNRVVTAETQIHVVSPRVTAIKLRRFITDLRLNFPLHSPKIQPHDLYYPNEIRHLIVAINLVADPTEKISHTSSNERTVHSSPDHLLVGSLSIIYRNRWNEILIQHFEGREAFLRALKFLSNKICLRAEESQAVNVFCYSQQYTQELQTMVEERVQRCLHVPLTRLSEKQSNAFHFAEKKWQSVFAPTVQHACDLLAQNIVSYHLANRAPKEIHRFACEGFLQFFFQDNPDSSFNVYILDKHNGLECHFHCAGSAEEKVKQITHRYTAQQAAQADSITESFNFPQFYQLVAHGDQFNVIPFQSKRSH